MDVKDIQLFVDLLFDYLLFIYDFIDLAIPVPSPSGRLRAGTAIGELSRRRAVGEGLPLPLANLICRMGGSRLPHAPTDAEGHK